ncbi:MAG: glycosyltransferase family 1 protein [bacterium]|nr:glycosyltransferase family 1 protein [bacterium]
MARIGIDCRFASLSVGLGTYTRNIVDHLVRPSEDVYVLFVRATDEDWIKKLQGNFELVIADFPHYSFKEQISLPKLLTSSHVDLFYSPHFNVPYFCSVPYVVTVHDLILHRYPNNTSLLKRIVYRLLMKQAVLKAQHVISVSNFTKSELRSVYPFLRDEQMTVVTEGIDSSYKPTEDSAVLDFYDLELGYFLYVGTAKQHKNVQKLIDVYAKSCTPEPLIIVSNGKEVDSLQIRGNVRILLGVDHDELPALYSNAKCFVTASSYEGFCLPILEARACGCPVIAQNVSAIPEVAGEHAILIDGSEESLINAFKNPPKKSDPPDKRFDWKKSADAISAILTDASHG